MRPVTLVIAGAGVILSGWILFKYLFPASTAQVDLSQGAALYAAHCASCHGAELEGAPNWQRRGPDGRFPAPPHDETGHTWHHGDQLLFDYTKLGGKATLAARGVENFNSGMPGFGDLLTDDEILDILAFIKSSWPELQRNHQEKMTRQEAASQE